MSTTQIVILTLSTLVINLFLPFIAYVYGYANGIRQKRNSQLSIIIQNQKNMATQLEQLSASLDAANEKVAKVAADVQHLHDLITQAGDNPTPEQWAAVQAKADTLNNSLQAVDDQTEDTTTQG